MPYQGEFATNKGNQIIMADNKIRQELETIQFISKKIEYPRLDTRLVKSELQPHSDIIQYVFVLDGSKYESEIEENTDIKLALINVNQCVIEMSELLAYLREPFPLPKQFQKIKKDINLSCILPLKGMKTAEHEDEKDFFRSFLYKMLARMENPLINFFNDKGLSLPYEESVLQTYENLLSHMNAITPNAHPCPDCRRAGRSLSLKAFKNEKGWLTDIACKCDYRPRTLYITDFLGFHEQLNNEHSNESLTTQIMLVLERLALLNLLRVLKKNNAREILEKSAFIMDGSLAIYSHASWLSQAINKEIYLLKEEHEVLIVGVEKTGNFVDFFRRMENHFSTEPLKKGMLFFLDDHFIKDQIKVYDNEGFYGEKNYFGKKLFYKNRLGKLFVINLAFDNEMDRSVELNARNTDSYIEKCQKLSELIMILDNFSSQSYPDALSFISLAHEGAALSSSYFGKKLLNDFIHDVLKK